jgi:hypothetical protein
MRRIGCDAGAPSLALQQLFLRMSGRAYSIGPSRQATELNWSGTIMSRRGHVFEGLVRGGLAAGLVLIRHNENKRSRFATDISRKFIKISGNPANCMLPRYGTRCDNYHHRLDKF